MRILRRLWNDELGALISAEYLLIGTVLTIGVIVGVNAIQDALLNKIQALADMVCP